MTALLTMGWWIAVIAIVLLLLIFAAAAFGEWEERRHRPSERILEYLSGKRDWVRGYEIHDSLGLPIGLFYVTVSRLEDEGAVVSEQRNDRIIAGRRYAQRYYKATGTRRPDETSASLQPALSLS